MKRIFSKLLAVRAQRNVPAFILFGSLCAAAFAKPGGDAFVDAFVRMLIPAAVLLILVAAICSLAIYALVRAVNKKIRAPLIRLLLIVLAGLLAFLTVLFVDMVISFNLSGAFCPVGEMSRDGWACYDGAASKIEDLMIYLSIGLSFAAAFLVSLFLGNAD